MEQKYNELVARYNNDFCEVVDPENLDQCFDLAVAWTNLLGVPHFPGNPSPFPVVSAADIFRKPNSVTLKYFDFIASTPENYPICGDVVVWTLPHVAIANGNGNAQWFEAFEQNDPTGSKCHVKQYRYDYVIGWLRFKLPIASAVVPAPAQDMQYSTDWRIIFGKKGIDENSELGKQFQAIDRTIEDARNKAIDAAKYDLNQKFIALQEERSTQDKILVNKSKEYDKLVTKKELSDKALTECQNKPLPDPIVKEVPVEKIVEKIVEKNVEVIKEVKKQYSDKFAKFLVALADSIEKAKEKSKT